MMRRLRPAAPSWLCGPAARGPGHHWRHSWGAPSRAASGAPIAVVIHGGAWAIPEDLAQPNVRACQAAAAAAYGMLTEEGSALDAVEAAVRVLEADESLNAGRGCSLTEAGEPECDAMIMDGSLSCGAVAGVQAVHPVSLARRVMERTPHVLMAGPGAMAFAAAEGIPAPRRDEIVTAGAEEEWRTWSEYKSNVSSLFSGVEEPKGDTVGCVALDARGRLACGTSTGGVVGKRPGRVGDSPLVGCGGYADAEVGAVSTTGHGEAIAKVTLARLALWFVEGGLPPGEAAAKALEVMRTRCGEQGGGRGGLIMVSRSGEVALSFTTRRMAWASAEGSAGSPARRSQAGIDRGLELP